MIRKSGGMKWLIGGVALAALMAAGTAIADDYHYNNIIIGDRATGMGGAYTAVSDDPSGMYYNPAGIVYSGKRNLSASVNAYHATTTTYKDVFGAGSWTRHSSALLPNFFGVTEPLGKGTIGFSYAVTDAIQENQDQVVTGSGAFNKLVLNVNNQDNTYKVGPSYAQAINDHLSLGVTLYLHIRNSEQIVNQQFTLNNGDYWQNGYLQTDEWGVEPILGLMWTPLDKLSIGVSVRQTTVLSESVKFQNNCLSTSASATCATAFNTSPVNGSTKRDYPLTVSLGVAYFPTDRLLYSADFVYYEQANGVDSSHLDSYVRTKVATWNARVGFEYYYSSDWALRGGLYTNNANSPTLVSGGVNQPDNVNYYGLSLSLSRFTRNSSITGGFSYSTGNGKAQAISGVTNIQDVTANSLTLFLSTSYSY